ncbi:MAG TPA: DUF1592 domain-containing protein, partial [Planctomycetota bacterium]
VITLVLLLAPQAVEPTQAFLDRHCRECHGAEKPKGDFRLGQLAADPKLWLKVREQVVEGAMPPAKKPRPSKEEIDALAAAIDVRVAAAENARRAAQGRVLLRRLNRVEYQNTVRDLLGIDIDLNEVLPLDPVADGFDNNAEALRVSSFSMEQYLEAADRVLNAAIANTPKPWSIQKRYSVKDERSVKATGDVYRHLEDAVAIFSSWESANICVTMWNFTTKFRGRYRVKISAYGFQTGAPVRFRVLTGTFQGVTESRLVGYFEVPAGKPSEIDFVAHMEPRNTLRIIAEGLGVTPPTVQKAGAQNYKGPGLAVQWVDVDGPLMEEWPPASHRKLLGELSQAKISGDRLEVVSEKPAVDALRVLRDFARRAFRREDVDLQPYLARVKAKLAAGDSFEQALRVGLKAILVAPDFLYLREKPGKLDEFALASRLSYFLWSSMPDEELLGLAAKKELSTSLRPQVERMLKNPKAAAFTRNFAGQWLNLRAIDATVPDPALYPEYNDVLKVAMVQEATLFFDELLKNDLSLTRFVASDFTMLNGPLAQHYGIPGVEGLEFRRVPLPPGSPRGGVLTMAAVLKVTANGTSTSPILRGAWVLDRVLGTPPPKPTVDVEAVEPDIRGATTIREQLAKHRERPECASCHRKIDPPGFALESFDVIGGWRDHYRSVGKGEAVPGRRYLKGPAVDPSDVLFKDIHEYKELLLKDPDLLARALAGKLLGYATGGPPATADKPDVEAIVRAIRDKDYGLRSLVHEIVASRPFLHK